MVGVVGTAGQSSVRNVSRLVVAEDIPMHSGEIAELLKSRGFQVALACTTPELESALGNGAPDLIVLVNPQGTDSRPGPVAAACQAAGTLGVPTLAVVDDLNDPEALTKRLEGVDDWVALAGIATEIPIRVTRLLHRTLAKNAIPTEAATSPTFGPKFLSLVVHDLRTPLNVIGLSLRIISQSVPRNDPEVMEDLRFLEENFQLMVRMLAQLGDYHRLYEVGNPPDPMAFSPARLVDDIVYEYQSKGPRNGQITLRVEPSCPPEVTLDQVRAKLAIQYALLNATNASRGGPVLLTLRGEPGRWLTEISTDQPPPPSVRATSIEPLQFERICGIDAERRGMDLSIGARVSELFGGSARLDVNEGRGTTVVLDWPVALNG